MKYFRVIVYAITFEICHLSAAYAQSDSQLCPPETFATRIYFGNGVEGGNSKEDQEPSRLLLENTLRGYVSTHTSYQLPIDCQVISTAFNKGNGLIRDLIQSAEQLIAADSTILSTWLQTSLLPQLFIDTISASIQSRTFEIVDNDPELIAQVEEYRQALQSGQRVVVVAHSQGNLYANKAYQKLGNAITTFSRFNVVSLATPDSTVAANGPWITSFEDFAATALFWIVNRGRKAPDATNEPTDCIPLPGCHAFATYLLGRRTGPAVLSNLLDVITPFNEKPVAHVTIDGNAEVLDGRTVAVDGGNTVALSSAASNDVDGAVVSRQWYINGRPISTEATVGLQDLEEGEYTINLIVYDQLGASSAPATVEVIVHSISPPPPASLPRIDSITPTTPVAGPADQHVTVN
jgi:hypothetical protein